MAPPRPPRLPITPDLLGHLFSFWSRVPQRDNYDAAMLWAACCVAFFGFMRAGEFTCPSRQAFDSTMLAPHDVTVDSHSHPTCVTVHLRRSKMDQFSRGVHIYLGKTGQAICPVSALLGYLVRRGQSPGPLFLFQDGSSLSRHRLLVHVNRALSLQGVNTAGVNGHSFRIGAATAAARPDSMSQSSRCSAGGSLVPIKGTSAARDMTLLPSPPNYCLLREGLRTTTHLHDLSLCHLLHIPGHARGCDLSYYCRL